MAEVSLKDIEQIVRDTDKTVKAGTPGFKTAVVLLASLQLGPNIRGLTRYTGYGRHFIRLRAKRLFDFGVWTRDGKVQCSFINEEGKIAMGKRA